MLGNDVEAIDVEHLTKREAAAVLDNAFEKQEKAFADIYGLCPKCGQALKLTKNKKSFTCTSNHWSQDGSWRLVSGCGTTFKVRADGHCIKPADLKAFARTVSTYGAERSTPSSPRETPVTSVPSDASGRPMMTPDRVTALTLHNSNPFSPYDRTTSHSHSFSHLPQPKRGDPSNPYVQATHLPRSTGFDFQYFPLLTDSLSHPSIPTIAAAARQNVFPVPHRTLLHAISIPYEGSAYACSGN